MSAPAEAYARLAALVLLNEVIIHVDPIYLDTLYGEIARILRLRHELTRRIAPEALRGASSGFQVVGIREA